LYILFELLMFIENYISYIPKHYFNVKGII